MAVRNVPMPVRDDQPVMRAIQVWSGQTFTTSTAQSTLAHLKREVMELEAAIHDGNVRAVADELADGVHLLCQLARHFSLDLDTEVRSKFERNQMRTWKPPDHEGVVEHELDFPAIPKLQSLTRETGKHMMKTYLETHVRQWIRYDTLMVVSGLVDVSRTCRTLRAEGMDLLFSGQGEVYYKGEENGFQGQ